MSGFTVKPEKGGILVNLNRAKIEKLIRITATYLAVSHMLVAVAIPLYNIIVPTMRGIEYTFGLFLVFELLFLLLYICINSQEPRKEIAELAKNYFTKDQLLLGLLPLVFFISIVANTILDGYVRYPVNSKNLFDMLISVFVTYSLGRYYVHHQIPKALEVIIHVVITGVTAYIVYILVTVFQGESIKTFFRGFIGINRLEFYDIPEYHLQINCHHNVTGAFAATFMLICVCMSVWKKGFFRIFYLIESFIHSLVLVLSNSRSNFLSGAVFLAVYMGLIFYFVINHKMKKGATAFGKTSKWVLSIVVVVGAFFVMCALRGSVFSFYQMCTEEDVGGEKEIAIFEEEATVEQVEARNLDVTNLMSREIIWAYAIQGMTMSNRNLFFGVTPAGVVPLYGELSNGDMYLYTHNQMLEIGLSFGVFGMVVFAIWLIFLANRCVIIGFAEETKHSLKQKLIPLLVLYFVMFNLVEAYLFCQNSFVGGVFMLSSAWCFETVRGAKVNSTVFRIRTDNLKKVFFKSGHNLQKKDGTSD